MKRVYLETYFNCWIEKMEKVPIVIVNINLQQYLEDENRNKKFEYIKIPGNLYLFATMNTSDQNVFILDTAFKRRWKFEKIKNTFKENHPYMNYFVPGMDIDWKTFCEKINELIISDRSFINSDDKQLGVYFIDKECLRNERVDMSSIEKRKQFAFKIFEYLWNDVAKFDHQKWFGEIRTLDQLIENYVVFGDGDKEGSTVFLDGIFK